jgi:hypothetical protein
MALKRRPQERIQRRDRRADWVILPFSGTQARPPAWPDGIPSDQELAHWEHLWSLPVSLWWREQRISPLIVADYVRLRASKPEHSTCSQLAKELGLTPAAMLRLRLIVEKPESEPESHADPYAHLREGARDAV